MPRVLASKHNHLDKHCSFNPDDQDPDMFAGREGLEDEADEARVRQHDPLKFVPLEEVAAPEEETGLSEGEIFVQTAEMTAFAASVPVSKIRKIGTGRCEVASFADGELTLLKKPAGEPTDISELLPRFEGVKKRRIRKKLGNILRRKLHLVIP